MSSQYFLAIISSISSIILITPNGNLISIKQSLCILLPQPLTTPSLLSVCMALLVWVSHLNRVIKCLSYNCLSQLTM